MPEERCEICGERPAHQEQRPEDKRLRGFLCFDCMAMLNGADDDPVILRAAADYVERWGQVLSNADNW